MSDEDLERYEATIELQLVQEYKAVIGLFSHIVETERRFYLTNSVEVTVRAETSPPLIELKLTDAWVWDMYRARLAAGENITKVAVGMGPEGSFRYEVS